MKIFSGLTQNSIPPLIPKFWGVYLTHHTYWFLHLGLLLLWGLHSSFTGWRLALSYQIEISFLVHVYFYVYINT